MTLKEFRNFVIVFISIMFLMFGIWVDFISDPNILNIKIFLLCIIDSLIMTLFGTIIIELRDKIKNL